jgi:hypothetical protein
MAYDEVLPMIFVPPSAIQRYDNKVIKASEMERAILTPYMLPTKASNIKKPQVDSLPSNGNTACVPVLLERASKDDDYDDTQDGSKEKISVQILLNELKHQLLTKVNESANYTNTQKVEIKSMVESKKIRGRWILPSSAESHKQALEHVMKAYQTKSGAPNHVVSQHDGITFFITGKGLRLPGANHMHVYAVFYTKASADVLKIKTAHLLSRIPKTNGKSIFSLSDKKTAVPLVAGGVSGLSEESLKSPQDLEKGLRNYLNHWKTSELVVAREIQSASERFRLAKKGFNYQGPKNNDVHSICARLSAEYGIKMNIKYGRSSSDVNGHFNIKSISW